MAYQQRDDNVPGYVYLFKAKGFHGWLPGAVLGRYKIGLSRNVERRLDTLHSNQPPTDLLEVKTIAVDKMLDVEQELHHVFKNSNVKLIKSREYFDLMPWQIAKCLWLMHRYEKKSRQQPIPSKAVASGLMVLLGVGLLIGQSFQSNSEPTRQIKMEKSVKSK